MAPRCGRQRAHLLADRRSRLCLYLPYCDEPEPIAVRADPPWCRGKMELERKASQGALGLPIDVSAIS